jgi:hypothetical protein
MKQKMLWWIVLLIVIILVIFCSSKEGWKPTNLKHFYRAKFDNLYDMPKSYGIIANSLECSNKTVLRIIGYIYHKPPVIYNSNRLPVRILDSYTDLENRVYTYIFCDDYVDTLYMEVVEDYLPERIIDSERKTEYSFDYPDWIGIEDNSDNLSWTSTTNYCVRAKNGNYIFKLSRK